MTRLRRSAPAPTFCGSALLGLTFVVAFVIRVSTADSAPPRLSETGLFLAGTTAVDPRNRPFAPQYPLWTDGARKSRWVRLPDGATIDAGDADRWVFPVGTRFWKEFAFGDRRVETRMIWRSSERTWSYATYVWNDAQTDAVLAPADGVESSAEVAPGKRHVIPSVEDCRTCHENTGTPVLGFTALQLSDDRDPLAPHADAPAADGLTVSVLVNERLLAPVADDLARRSPRIPGDPTTRAALGYLTANCGHCHNEQSSVATVRMPLRLPAFASPADVTRAIDALLARTSQWDPPHAVAGSTRVVAAGAAESSALFQRMRSRRPSAQMPPLGTMLADGDALDLLSRWIEGLTPRRTH